MVSLYRRKRRMKNSNKTSVLIIDNDPNNLAITKTTLQELNCSLVVSFTAKEALGYLLRHNFSAILLNIKTTIGNAFELIRLMRSWEKLKYIPILILAARDENEGELINSINTLQGVDYLPKPVNPIILRAKVQAFINVAAYVTSNMQQNSSQPILDFVSMGAAQPNHD
jgi:two-component system, sporulation sensor kinase E